MITVPADLVPLEGCHVHQAPSGDTSTTRAAPSPVMALVTPHGVDLTARRARLQTAGWVPQPVLLAPAPGRDWHVVADAAQQVLQGVVDAGAVEAEVWFTEPEVLLAIVERLWHHGVRISIMVDPGVASSAARQLLSGSGAPGPAQQTVLDACAHADRVVPLHGADVSLLSTYRGIFGRVRVDRHDAPVASPRRLSDSSSLQLSVLVTTYDRPDALDRCLAALSGSTLATGTFEVVVVDDGSPRSAESVVNSHTHHLDVRLVRLPENVGLGAARTAGLDHVRAGVTMLLDDDDEVTPRCLEEHLLVHEERPEEMVAVLGATSVLPDGGLTALSRHVTVVGRQYFAYPIVRNGDVHTWRAFWGGRSSAKTSLLRRHGFPAPFMEDADFALRAKSEGLQVVYAGRALQVVTDRLSLTHFRKRQNRIGHAMHDLATTHDDPDVWFWAGLDPVTANLSQWVAQRHDFQQILDQLVHQPIEALRATPWERPGQPPVSMLQLLDHVLLVDLDAHYAVGMIAAMSRRRADDESRRVRIGMTAADPQMAETVGLLAGRDGVEAVVLVPDGAQVASVASVLEDLIAQAHGDVHVELLVSPDGLTGEAADLVLPGSMGSAWSAGMPAPLIGQDLTAWVTQIASSEGLRGALR